MPRPKGTNKAPQAYRLDKQTIADIETLVPIVRRLTDKNSSATAVVEFAIKELVRRYVDPTRTTGRIGPANCSECGNPAQEGTFLCVLHAKMV